MRFFCRHNFLLFKIEAFRSWSGLQVGYEIRMRVRVMPNEMAVLAILAILAVLMMANGADAYGGSRWMGDFGI